MTAINHNEMIDMIDELITISVNKLVKDIKNNECDELIDLKYVEIPNLFMSCHKFLYPIEDFKDLLKGI